VTSLALAVLAAFERFVMAALPLNSFLVLFAVIQGSWSNRLRNHFAFLGRSYIGKLARRGAFFECLPLTVF
jgi:hypothetical protein